MKTWPKSNVIRERQIKNHKSYHRTRIRMAKIQKIETTHSGYCEWECRARGTLVHCWWECRITQPLWESIWQFLTNPNSFTIQPCKHSPGYLPNWFETFVHTYTFMWISIVAFYIIATKISFNKRDEQTVVHLYNRVLLTDKK